MARVACEVVNVMRFEGHTGYVKITMQYVLAEHTSCDSVNQRKSPELLIPVNKYSPQKLGFT